MTRPSATFVLWLDLVGRDRAAEIIAAATGRSLARCFVVRTNPDPGLLRAQCTSEEGLAAVVIAWFETLGFRLEAVAKDFISAALLLPFSQVSTVLRVAIQLDIKVTRVREGLKRSGFSSPRDLLEILRLFRVALAASEDTRFVGGIGRGP